MRRFLEFQHDIRWAYLVALIALPLTLAYEWGKYQFTQKEIDTRIAFYGKFTYPDDSVYQTDQPEYRKFVSNIRLLLGGTDSDALREKAWLSVMKKEFEEKRALLLSLNQETTNILISLPEAIPNLIAKEEKQKSEMRIQWFTHLPFVFMVWKITSVICLLVYWWRDSYLMSYFPWRKWWFWVYGVIAYPWSLGIGFFLAIYLAMLGVTRGLSKLYAAGAPQTYDELIALIKKDQTVLKQKWAELFPAAFTEKRIQELETKLPALRRKLTTMGEDMTKATEEYYGAKSEFSKLTSERRASQNDNKTSGAAPGEWNQEIDRILADPHVRTARLNEGDGWLEIFTTTFTSLGGQVGPFRIRIGSRFGGEFEAQAAHVSAVGGLNPGWGHVFCFGDSMYLLSTLIQDHKISDAVKMMFVNFESNGSS